VNVGFVARGLDAGSVTTCGALTWARCSIALRVVAADARRVAGAAPKGDAQIAATTSTIRSACDQIGERVRSAIPGKVRGARFPATSVE
jgi:hypothetical protein